MDQDTSQKIGLFRHRIISPVLMEKGRNQMEYFRKLSKQKHDIPGVGLRRISPTTMKTWLNRYRKHGFQGICPKTRSDKGRPRCLSREQLIVIKEKRSECAQFSGRLFYDTCLKEGLLGDPPICYSSLLRLMKQEGMATKTSGASRKRYEMDRFGELWVGDFCHGPSVKDGQRKRKAIILAIIDDFSRYIVGASFAYAESTKEIEQVFKQAILSFGIPDRLYVDNGPSFSSKYLATTCAELQIGLVHSKPYDSPSRGKIERFFRTVRSRFFPTLPDNLTLNELNELFGAWLYVDYNMKKHSAIQLRPWDRYKDSIKNYPMKRVSKEELDEFFMAKISRDVRKDATVSINAVFYEVPQNYIRQTVEIRFVQADVPKYYLYDQGQRVCQIMPVDSKANAKSYRPSPRKNIIDFHKEN
jgi:putative transposase